MTDFINVSELPVLESYSEGDTTLVLHEDKLYQCPEGGGGGESDFFTAYVDMEGVDIDEGVNLIHNGEPVNYQELLGMIEAGKPRIITLSAPTEDGFFHKQITDVAIYEEETSDNETLRYLAGEITTLKTSGTGLRYQQFKIIADEDGNAIIDTTHVIQKTISFSE